jgi:hypothetical protein
MMRSTGSIAAVGAFYKRQDRRIAIDQADRKIRNSRFFVAVLLRMTARFLGDRE